MAWTDVYTQFEKIVNRNFGKGSNWERKIEKEVDDLYKSHKGQRDWDEAYRRWRQDQNAQDCGTLDAIPVSMDIREGMKIKNTKTGKEGKVYNNSGKVLRIKSENGSKTEFFTIEPSELKNWIVKDSAKMIKDAAVKFVNKGSKFTTKNGSSIEILSNVDENNEVMFKLKSKYQSLPVVSLNVKKLLDLLNTNGYVPTKDADDAVKYYQKQLDELRIKLEEIQRKYKYRGYQSDWQYKNYAREYDKTSKLLEKAKAEEQGEEVISKAKLTSAIKRIAGLETLKTTTSAIRGYRPVSGGDFYLEGSTSDNWISIILYSKKAKSKRNGIIDGLTKMGYEARNSSFNNDDIQVKTKKKKTKDSALDAKSGVHRITYKDIDGIKQSEIIQGDVNKFNKRVKELEDHDCKILKKELFMNWSKDAQQYANTLSEAKKIISKLAKLEERYVHERKSGNIFYFSNTLGDDVGMWDSNKKTIKMYDAANGSVDDYLKQMNNKTQSEVEKILRQAKGNPNADKAYRIWKSTVKDADGMKEYTYSIRIGGDLKRVKVKANNASEALDKVKKEAIKFKMERVKSKWDNNKLSTRDLR